MSKETKKEIAIFVIAIILFVSLILGIVLGVYLKSDDEEEENFIYLSDIDYIEDKSFVGWDKILEDKTVGNTKISVKIEGVWYDFDKGLFTHAPAEVVYDISSYDYKYFTAYTGLDKLITKKSDGVKFFVYVSEDGETWTLKTSENPNVLGIGAEAEYLKVDITGSKYLKLVVDANVNNGADYAVWAEAKLTDGKGIERTVLSVSDYDEKIKAKDTTSGVNNEELELLVLQREFADDVGQYALKRFMGESKANKDTINWLFSDVDILREFIMGGAPVRGSYYNSLKVLSDLYRNYKGDLNNKTLLNNKWAPNRTYGDLYRTMMFSIALTHDNTVGSWMQASRVENQSDPLRRYAIYRYMHKTGRFIATTDSNGTPIVETNSLFESLTVEETRWIMYNIIDDESIIWLNDYVQTKINANPASAWGLHTPHSYIAYTSPNYGNPVYYNEENIDYFNELFAVDDRNNPGKKIGMWDTKYVIPGGVDHPTYTLTISRGTENDKIQKVWMNFRNKFGTGCVCGGISKSGTNIRGARGIPTTVIGQPGHAAILYYTKNSEGKGYWSIDNNVGGWTVATKGERHLLGWGNESWQRTHATVVYFHLAQDALNDYDSYVKAEENVMLAKAFEGNLAKQEALYEKALSIQPINIDAWYGLIETYKANNSTNEQKYYDLACRIANTMVGYPLPMHDLLLQIKPQFTSTEYVYSFTVLADNALKESSTLPNTATDKTLIPSAARVEAQYLLGDVDTSIASFSFDGENAGCIVLSSRFDNSGIRWRYSLDGKQTWKEVAFTGEEEHKYKLTEIELNSITEENDIYIYIVGAPQNDNNYYKIDITSKPSLPKTLYGNDLENKILGINDNFEWRYEGNETWTSYASAAPDCTGNKTVEVRIKASGDNPPSDIKTFVFTEDTDTITRKYISVSHMSVVSFSSQSLDPKRPNYATNAIDGNLNTYWHTNYAENILTSGNDPYLVIKLDSARYISGLEFVQYQYSPKINIFAKSAKVLVSEDGTNWTEVGHLDDLEAADDLRSVVFEKVVRGSYIKLEMKTHDIFATLSMVNIYEDTTK